MFVRQADEAVTLRSTSAGIVYLDHAELERALLESKADAVWVGWGFVAEDIAFAELCARLKLTFIGPPPAAMRTLGDKVEAKFWPRRWAFRSHRGAVAPSRPARTPAGTQRPSATR